MSIRTSRHNHMNSKMGKSRYTHPTQNQHRVVTPDSIRTVWSYINHRDEVKTITVHLKPKVK
jgi:hypothetical protein